MGKQRCAFICTLYRLTITPVIRFFRIYPFSIYITSGLDTAARDIEEKELFRLMAQGTSHFCRLPGEQKVNKHWSIS
jgi:hypothetical protein